MSDCAPTGYGQGGYGLGGYGTGGYPDGGSYDDLADAYADTLLPHFPNTGFDDVLLALACEFDRLRHEFTVVEDRHTVNSAVDGSLDRIAALVGVTRRNGETDTELRRRTIINGMAALSSGTTDELMTITATAFDVAVDDSGLTFTLDLDNEPAEMVVEVSSSIAQNSVLSLETVEAVLESAAPAAHRVIVFETGGSGTNTTSFNVVFSSKFE